ncbi:hypothetical protein ACO0LG_08745 [Undibacterium sp. Ji42W]|uniref:hypothetical protein n=1 Tax=Undibacterium sp. Ji42W TaxID=3413039 RepID=UPI003BF3059C
MPTIHVAGFSGLIPRSGATLLASNQAQLAQNVKLRSGELRSWRKPVAVFTPVQNNIQSIFKLNGPAGASQWLEWTTQVDVCRPPTADNADYRIYFTGSGTPKKTNWALATSGVGAKPGAVLDMGVPAPVAAPGLSASGGSAPAETRAYVYTYVSTFGAVKEESAPSPASLVTCNAAGSTVVVNGFSAAPTTNYNITHIRIYRSVTGTTTSTYFQVAEIPIATTSYNDTLAVGSLGAALYTQLFTPPPAGLQGLVNLPNGILAGFVDNQVWFSEPGYPHAFPSKYSLSVDYPIVGMGMFNNSLVVLTTRNPYVITGTTPSAMSQEKLSIVQPCVSRKSIVSDQFGMMYASADGLVAIGPGVQDIVTAKLYTRDDWAMVYPSTMTSVLYDGNYLGFYNTGSQKTGIAFSRNDAPALTNLDFPAACIYQEPTTGYVYACSSDTNKIFQLDADQINSGTYTWKSMKYVLTNPLNFGAIKLDADFIYMRDTSAYQAALAVQAAQNATIFAAAATTSLGGCFGDAQLNGMMLNGSNLVSGLVNPLDFRSASLVVFADGKQVFATGVTSMEPIRMPAGYKAYEWEVQITGNVPVRGFVMSTTVGELRQVSSGMN